MQEQVMVTDALNSLNAGLKSLSDMISQTENQELRQTLQKMRNDAETCQYELYTIAKSKNYYQPAQKATQDEIMTVKNFVNQSSQSAGQSQSGEQSWGQSTGQSQGMSQMR
jgi:spore coat protein CotF